jgi:acyl-homoserine lactone acylase PvdQ
VRPPPPSSLRRNNLPSHACMLAGLLLATAASTAIATPTEIWAGLQAYADGVNHFPATRPLPPEYGVLETTQVDPCTPLDSVAINKLIAFSLLIAH